MSSGLTCSMFFEIMKQWPKPTDVDVVCLLPFKTAFEENDRTIRIPKHNLKIRESYAYRHEESKKEVSFSAYFVIRFLAYSSL